MRDDHMKKTDSQDSGMREEYDFSAAEKGKYAARIAEPARLRGWTSE